jgi:hypothetical protein
MEVGKSEIMPVEGRHIRAEALATIKTFLDAIIELVTNCDDSYRRIENKLKKGFLGDIEMLICRDRGGIWKEFYVKDDAEAMNGSELDDATRFGKKASKFDECRGIKGLFGKGLKETIIALGEGEIISIKDNKISIIKIWWDNEKKQVMRKPEKLDETIKKEDREDYKIPNNGTLIRIKVKTDRIKVPDFETLEKQIEKHFALRDINSSKKRNMILYFEDIPHSIKRRKNIKYEYPQGKKVLDKKLRLTKYKDFIELVVFESKTPLFFRKYDPSSEAGVLIKVDDIILDNKLFKFESDYEGQFFFGYALCDCIKKRIIEEEASGEGDLSIIDANRGGINWVKDSYAQEIAKAIEKELEKLILKKRKELQEEQKKEISNVTKKRLKELMKELNQLAKNELGGGEIIDEEIDELMIKPETFNIEKGKKRPVSVYSPEKLVDLYGVRVFIESSNPNIKISTSEIKLSPHKKHKNIFYGYFIVYSDSKDETGVISVMLGDERAVSSVSVVEEIQQRKRKNLAGSKKAFITDIQPDNSFKPLQRSRYDKETGIIYICVNYEATSSYIEKNLDIKREGGEVLLAEIIGEVFCTQLAIKKIEAGGGFVPGSEIDGFLTVLQEKQKEFLVKIHAITMGWLKKK